MEKAWDSARRASRRLSNSIGRGVADWGIEDVFAKSDASDGGVSHGDDEEALLWAAIKRLPTYHRLHTGILKSAIDCGGEAYEHREVDVRKLRTGERQEFIERAFRVTDEDNERFLKKLRDRVDRYVRCLMLCPFPLTVWATFMRFFFLGFQGGDTAADGGG